MLAERTAHGAPEKPVNEIQQALLTFCSIINTYKRIRPSSLEWLRLLLFGGRNAEEGGSMRIRLDAVRSLGCPDVS
jgi:hypothetical protein